MTQPSSVRRAVILGLPASEPACDSERAMPTMPRPLVMSGTYFSAVLGDADDAGICPTSEPTTWT